MIVTCPACSVRYLVDSRALGAKGRTVRCARCAHTWHQDAPPDAVPADVAPPPPPPAPRERPPALAAEERIRLPALARPRRRRGPMLAWTAAMMLLIAALVGGALVERDRVARVLPGTARLYALAGFPVSDPGLGLVFRNVTTSRDTENGLPTLVIDGEVANVSSVARAVPKLVATLRDRSEHALQEQSFSISTERLLPGQAAPFHTSISQPADEASGVVVTFAGNGG